MRTDPISNKALLRSLLHDRYGLEASPLEFVASGEAAASYVLHVDRSYFLKVYGPGRQGARAASLLSFSLELTRGLRDTEIFKHVPVPVPTRKGELVTAWGGGTLVLFEFIDGRSLESERPLPDGPLLELAENIGTIHRRTAELHVDPARRETFETPFARELVESLETLERPPRADRPGPRRLRELLLPRRTEIREALERLDVLRPRGWDPARCVLTHGDLHGGNLILSANGTLHILDWEGALLAPRERDLIGFAQGDRHIRSETLPVFLDRYRRAAGAPDLDPTLFRFYFHQRCLEDLTDWVVRILVENRSEEEDSHDLAGISSECLAWLPRIEDYTKTVELYCAGP